jgi:hypothetical protein
MPFTPAHIAQAKGVRSRQLIAQELIRVRTLYVEKRYKNCIAACDELLELRPATPLTPSFAPTAPAYSLHPVHRAFLIFHQAISYECLGIAAHKYSQNKLRFLESAQQKYDEALNVLPQPFANAEDGHAIYADDTPDLRYGDDESRYDVDDSGSIETAVPSKRRDDSGAVGQQWHVGPSKEFNSYEHRMMPAVEEDDINFSWLQCRLETGPEEVDANAEDLSPISLVNFSEARAVSEGMWSSGGREHVNHDDASITHTDRSRSSSSASIVSTSTGSDISRAVSAPNFDDYSPRQDAVIYEPWAAPVHTPDSAQAQIRFPRSTPFIDIGSIESDSSEEDQSLNSVHSALPRSMRSLNLAAHDFSGDGSDSAGGIPSKTPVARLKRSSTIPKTSSDPYDSSSADSDSTVGTPSKIPTACRSRSFNSPGSPLAAKTPLTRAVDSLRVAPNPSSVYTNRLSASLSSQHVLCEELVPSPLFNSIAKRGKKLSKIMIEDDTRPALPATRTPYLANSRLSLVATRKTAVQALISKFEGAIPSPGSSYITATPPLSDNSPLTLNTPITPRFQLIYAAFAPDPIQLHLEAYLTSRSLAAYNARLTIFRTCLRDAASQLLDMLQAAETVQIQHEQEKQAAALRPVSQGLPSNRLASMWLLSTPSRPSSAPAAARRLRRSNRANPASDTLTGKRGRDAGPRALEPQHSHQTRQRILLRSRVEESEDKRAERLRRLRDNGFRVRKEGKGWKGEEFYEELGRGVERELGP